MVFLALLVIADIMKTLTEKLTFKTQKQFEIVDITQQVRSIVARSKASAGIVTVFSPHTTAAIKLNHHEPLLLQDFMKLLYKLVPIDANYAHDLFENRTEIEPGERSNGHAHLKTFLLNNSETIPIINGELALGDRQNVLFLEMDGGRERHVIISISE